MKNLVLVGGASRSGTVSITSYLHLSDDVFMFGSGGPMHLLSTMSPEIWYKNANFRPSYPAIAAGKYLDLTTYVANKHQLKNQLKSLNLKYIGLRHDYAERYRETIFCLLKQYNMVKLIYCMRKNIEKLHISQRNNPYQRDILEFKKIIDTSYKTAVALKRDKELAANGFGIYAIDITIGGGDFTGLNRFLGLKPNELQLEWQQQNIQTNQRSPDQTKEILKKGYNKELLSEVVKYLEPKYYNTKRALQKDANG